MRSCGLARKQLAPDFGAIDIIGVGAVLVVGILLFDAVTEFDVGDEFWQWDFFL